MNGHTHFLEHLDRRMREASQSKSLRPHQQESSGALLFPKWLKILTALRLRKMKNPLTYRGPSPLI